MISLCFPGMVNYTRRSTQLLGFAKYLYLMTRRHGTGYSLNYLKCGQLAIQRSIAGNPVTSFRDLCPEYPLPRLSSDGLPRYIPARDRSLIRGGHSAIIR